MATTVAIAASFKIDPEKLEKWGKGNKPTDPEELKICNEILSQFQFIDGEWSPLETKAKKAKTTKTKGKKKATKKAASTTNSETASIKSNNVAETIVSEKAPDVEVFSDLKSEPAKVTQESRSPLPTAQVDLTATEEIADIKTQSFDRQAQTTKTKKTAKDEEAVKEEEKQPAADSSDKSKSDTATTEDNKKASEKDRDKSKNDLALDKETEDESEKIFFTAVGMIRAEVKFDDVENQHTVKFGGKTYPLFYARRNYTAFTGLKKEIETSGSSTQRLIVYPKFTHFPRKEEPPRVGFQLVGFDKGVQTDGVGSELKDNEFKISGIWQFIPVCRQPCISIFRNFSRDRLDYIKQAEVQSKVNFMKASHLPILWRDGPVKPFRFNPRLEKDQQAKTYFVQIKAKFLPQRDCFGFSEMLADPIEKPPRFLKASKADKAEVMKKVAKNRPPGKGKPPGRGKPPARSGTKPSGPRKVINKPVGKSAPSKQQ